MKLILYRKKFYDETTIGRLYLDEHFICWTCEDKQSIPCGLYEIKMKKSVKLDKVVPILIGVDGFDEVCIIDDLTNKKSNIITGLVATGQSVINTNLANYNVIKIINEGLKYGSFFIEIK